MTHVDFNLGFRPYICSTCKKELERDMIVIAISSTLSDDALLHKFCQPSCLKNWVDQQFAYRNLWKLEQVNTEEMPPRRKK